MGNVYIVQNSIARNAKKMYVGVNGTVRQVKEAYISDNNGVTRKVYSAYSPILFTGTNVYPSSDPAGRIGPANLVTIDKQNEAIAHGYTQVRITGKLNKYAGTDASYYIIYSDGSGSWLGNIGTYVKDINYARNVPWDFGMPFTFALSLASASNYLTEVQIAFT